MRRLAFLTSLIGFLALAGAAAAHDGIQRLAANGAVSEVTDRLVATVEGAGARVMALIDHGAGAQSVGSDIGDSVLVVFGNPAVGTPVMEQDRLAGLFLPLRVLVYEDAEGQVWLAYQDPAEMLAPLDGVDGSSEAVGRIAGALGRVTEAAAN